MIARIRFALIAAMFAALIGSTVSVKANEAWQYGDLTNLHTVTFEDDSSAIEGILTLQNGSSIPISFGNALEIDICYGSMRGNACSVVYTYFEDESGRISDSDGNGYFVFNRVHYMGNNVYMPMVSS